MAEVINIVPHIKKREEDNLEKIKEELEIELERLDFDMEKELNRYVIFDTSMYYNISKEENDDVSKKNAMKHLLTAFDMMVKLNEENAAIDIDNVITRLENNSY
tara:strand:+ start:248 stop:559 length:312 start_codon:yes stop_codon:yes gene_type:complete